MKVIGKVYEESWKNAQKFKLREDNRTVNQQNVKKIAKSFKEYGWIGEPITVTSNFYVVSGQHRLEAAVLAQINIKYIIEDKDVSTEALQDMSRASRKWTNIDYMFTQASTGNVNYKYFTILYTEFITEKGVLPTNALIAVVTRDYEATGPSKIIRGGLEFNAQQYEEAKNMCGILSTVVAPIKQNKKLGRLDYICKALLFMIDNGADVVLLKNRIESNYTHIRAVSNVEQALEMLEDVYNKRTRAEQKMYFMSLFKEYKIKKANKKTNMNKAEKRKMKESEG